MSRQRRPASEVESVAARSSEAYSVALPEQGFSTNGFLTLNARGAKDRAPEVIARIAAERLDTEGRHGLARQVSAILNRM